MKKVSIKTLAIFLCAALLLTTIPLSILADAQTPASDTGPSILYEVTSMRDQFTKVFYRDDGQYVAVSAGEALHYKDADGNWQDIDNTLVAATDENGQPVMTNTANDFKVELPQTLDPNTAVMVTDNNSGYSVSFTLLGSTTRIHGNAHNNANRPVNPHQANTYAQFEKKHAGDTYTNVVPDTDIQYDVGPQQLKESIVLKKKPNPNTVSYAYDITAPGLVAQLNADNSVSFFVPAGDGSIPADATPVFVMPAPVMFDSAPGIPAYSTDVIVTLTPTDTGYTLTLTPSLDWLRDNARVYPVTIDPTMTLGGFPGKLYDGYINSASPTMSYTGALINLSTNGQYVGIAYPWYVSGSTYGRLTKAALCYTTASSAPANTTINAYRVTGGFTAPTYTSCNSSITSTLLDSVPFPTAAGQPVQLDVTSLMYDVMYNNSGALSVALKLSGTSSATVYSLNSTTNAIPAYLEMTFTNGNGLDSHYDMHTIDMGRAGTASINDYLGTLLYQRHDMGFDNAAFPVSLDMTYDSDAVSAYNSTFGNLGYNQEFDRTISSLSYTIGGNLGNDKMLRDNNGVTHYFEPDPNDSTLYNGIDDYAGATLKYNGTAATLTIPNQLQLDFKGANASQITDLSKPTKPHITITSTSSSQKIVTDSAGNVYKLNYQDTGGGWWCLTSIEYYGTGSTMLSRIDYTRTGMRCLSVTYPDGGQVKYTFGTDSNLATITDVDGRSWQFTWSGAGGKVTKVQELASDGTAGDWMTIAYAPFCSTFTDSQDHKEIKQFDIYGNTTCVRDENGYAIFSAYSGNGQSHTLLGSSQVQIPGENNLVQNWDFNSGTTPWQYSYTHNPGTGTAPVPAMHNNTYLVSNQTAACYVTQRIPLDPQTTGKKGTTYTYGGWARVNSGILPLGNTTGNPRAVGMKIDFPRDSSVASDYVMPSFNFNPFYTSDWQYQKGTFTLPCNVAYIDIYFQVNYETNGITVTGAELQKQPLYCYNTDSGGNIVQMDGAAASASPFDKSKTLDDDITTDSAGNVTGWTSRGVSAEGVGHSYTYDAGGNLTASAVTNGRVSMTTQTQYDSKGHPLYSTDPMGNTTGYTCDQNLNTLQSVTDPAGSTTSYTYDTLQRLTGVSQPVSGLYGGVATMTNTYTYQYDRLTSLTSPTTTYHFNYNTWGLPTSVLAGSQTLVSYSYLSAARRLLSAITYGNGQSKSMTYDANNNLTGVRFNGDTSDRFTYTYDQKGTLIEKRDYVNMILTKYNGDIIEEWAFSADHMNGIVPMLHSYVRDGDTFIEKTGTSTLTYTEQSDLDGRPMQAAYSYDYYGSTVSAQTEYRYDDLGRLTNRGASMTAGGVTAPVYWQNILYRDLPSLKTSDQVYAVDYTFGSTASQFDKIYTYGYDTLGNIASISLNGALQQAYIYDAASQLTRVDDAVRGVTTTYLYDAGGNIREKKTYHYIAGGLGSLISDISYGYGNANLGDELTSYNGTAISYDGAGNPLNWVNGISSFTWEGGRQLKSLTKNGVISSYTYDDAGLRLSKTVNGVKTNYTWANSQITSQELSGQYTYFRYDANGQVMALNWQGEEYFYITNIQGDIIGIADAQGNLVVEYTYDEWGTCVRVTGDMANTLGADNPFRYRGYYFDGESGLYYLQSRYYDAVTSRYLNVDVPEMAAMGLLTGDVLSANLFAYCNNNPVNNIDPTGYVGVTKMVWYWWGFRLYMDSTWANRVSSVAGLTAFFGMFVPATVMKVVGGIAGLLFARFNFVKASGKGVIFEHSYFAAISPPVMLAYWLAKMRSQ